jgi:heme exporter protein A
MALTLTDLACARGGVTLLSGLTFAVAPGEALVLRGPNGAGKTTLLRTLAGLAPPAAGRIAGAEGAVLAGHQDAVKPTLTVAENLAFWAQVFATGTRAADAAMRTLDLQPLADRRAAELSAGQRRRLGLARLVVAGPGPWLMDEPTVSLDAASVARFAGLVGQHLAQGGIAVIATHIDLGLPQARVLDVSPYRSRNVAAQGDAFAGQIE